MVVRYDARNECVKVTVPRYVSFAAALEFAESKAHWIARQMEKIERVVFADGVMVPLFGEPVRLRHVGGRGVVQRVEGELHVSGDALFMARRVRDFIKKEMKRQAVERATCYASALGVRVASVVLRDTSSRWGSCSSRGRLSLCWRLAFAPREVMDYVVCHEVCHLVHHHHGDAFWQLVERLCPDYAHHERWLKLHGQTVWNYS